MHGISPASLRPPARVPVRPHAPMRHSVMPERRERDTPIHAAGAIAALWLMTVLARVLWVHMRRLAYGLRGLG
jgi:hypothetical protein